MEPWMIEALKTRGWCAIPKGALSEVVEAMLESKNQIQVEAWSDQCYFVRVAQITKVKEDK
jgi:hypothetical protein